MTLEQATDHTPVSSQQEKDYTARVEGARQETRRHVVILEQLESLKLQAQVLDRALITLTQNPEVGLRKLLPASIHLDRFQMELLQIIQQEQETIQSFEVAITWFTRRTLLGDELTETESEQEEGE